LGVSAEIAWRKAMFRDKQLLMDLMAKDNKVTLCVGRKMEEEFKGSKAIERKPQCCYCCCQRRCCLASNMQEYLSFGKRAFFPRFL